MINRKFGKLIEEYRKERGYSKKYLAQLTHLLESTIYNVERGLTGANLDTIKRLYYMLGISKEDFMKIFS